MAEWGLAHRGRGEEAGGVVWGPGGGASAGREDGGTLAGGPDLGSEGTEVSEGTQGA